MINKDLVSLGMRDVSFPKALNNNDWFVNTGSPHLIRWVDDVEGVDVYNEGKSIRNSKDFIENGVNVNLKTFSCKSTALHRASFIGNKDIVQLLLDYKANPDEKDCDGKTALHKCVEQFNSKKANPVEAKKYIETIKILLKKNSNLVNIADNYEKKPVDYCADLFSYLN
jgi:hypothetical protein